MRNLLLIPFLFILTPPVQAAPGRGGDFSILLVPSRLGPVQIGFDMEGRDGLRLMSYDPGSPAMDPFLHVWTGVTWARVQAEDFASGDFLRTPPLRVIVVGPPDPVVATLVEQSSRWTRREVLNIETHDPAEMVTSLGRILDFRPRDWRLFATRYGLELETTSDGRRGESWYDTYRASDLPPPTSPFRRRRRETEPEPGLRPIIRVEDIPEITEGIPPPAFPEDDNGEGYSLEANP